jgi:hypothetical protein
MRSEAQVRPVEEVLSKDPRTRAVELAFGIAPE